MNLPVRIVLLSALLALAGCATLQRTQPPTAPAAQPAAPAPKAVPSQPVPAPPATGGETLEDNLLFDILLGEIAGQREQLDVSVLHYLRAAEVSDDPRVAERALRIALFAKQEDAALTAARRWVELDPESVDARQSLAVLALHARIPEEAYDQFEYLLGKAADDTQVYQGITSLLARSEDSELALALMDRLVQQHPQSAQAHLAYSRLALHAENTDLALSEVEQALALQPRLVEGLIQRAGVRAKAGDSELAKRELASAIAAQPDNVELRMAQARLLLDMQDLPGAAEQFNAVVKLQPDNADAWYSLGLLALEQQQYKPAERYFRKLLDLGKREQEARYYLGRTRELREDFAGALEWYSQVTEGDYWLEAQTRVASMRAKTGDLDGARRLLTDLRTREPSLAVRLYLVEGDILSQAGKLREALDLYNRVLIEQPNNHDLLYARALVAERLDDLKLAEADLRRIVTEDPNNYHAWNAFGYTLADRTDRLKEALEYIQKAQALAPDEAAIIDSLGWVHYKLGNLALAERHLRRAYEMSKGDAEVAAHLGEVLWEQGKRKEARALWEKARRSNPDNLPLQKALDKYLP